MASEADFASDSDEGFRTKVSDKYLKYLKERIIQCITDSNDISAEVQHEQGKPAKLFVTIESAITSKTGRVPYPQKLDRRTSKHLLVKNLPESADEELLEMFFEHTKRQGGGPVKHVVLNKSDKTAVIEFEDANSVKRVLDKQPIKIQGTSVEVESFTPYLENNETIESIHLYGDLKSLAKELAAVQLKNSTPSGPITRLEIPVHVRCGGCGENPIIGQRYQCRSCDDFFSCNACLYRKGHIGSHVFTHISPGNDPLRSIHKSITCDGCYKKPVVGTRYKCIDCHDFDFCATCKLSKPHKTNHRFVEIV